MIATPPRFFWIAATVLLGLDIVRWVALLAQADVTLVADARHYWDLGQVVAEGDWLLHSQPIAYRTPGYPWFIGVIRWFWHDASPWHIAVAQGLLLTCTTALTALIVHRLTQQKLLVLLAMALSIASLSRASWINTVLTETFFTFMLALHFYVCLIWWQQRRFGRSLLASLLVGATLALLILIRPIALYLWVVHCVAYGMFGRWSRPRTQLLCNGLVMIGIVGIMLAPWMLRNRQLFEKAMITEFLGRNIWIVTYQSGSGAGLPLPDSEESREIQSRFSTQVSNSATSVRSPYDPDRIDDLRHTWHVSTALIRSGLNDAQVDQLMRQVALQSIVAAPGLWSEKAVRRFVNYYRCVANELPALGTRWLSHRLWWCQAIMLFVLVAVTIGIIRPTTRPVTCWLTGTIVYFGAVTALVEIPDYRYRLVIEPLCIVLSTYVCSSTKGLTRSLQPHSIEKLDSL